MPPIKTSELFEDDNLDAIIKKLAELDKSLDGVAVQTDTLTKSVTGLNAAQEENGEKILRTAKEVEQLDKAYDRYQESLSGAAIELAGIKNAQTQLNQVNKLEAKILASKKDSYNAQSAQLSINKIRLKQLTEEEKLSTEAGKKLVAETNDLTESLKRQDKQIGVNTRDVGNYAAALDRLGGPLTGVIRDLKLFRDTLKGQLVASRASISGLTGLSKGFRILKIAIIATGIGLLVVALGALVTWLSKTQDGMDFLSKATDIVAAVFSTVLKRIALIGEAVVKVFQRDWEGAMNSARAATTGLVDEIKEVVKVAGDLSDANKVLERSQRSLSVEFAKQRAVIKLLNKEAEDVTLSFKKRADSAKEATAIESNLMQQRLDLATEAIRLARVQEGIDGVTDATQQIIAERQIEFFGIQENSFELQTTLQNKINAIEKERIANQKILTALAEKAALAARKSIIEANRPENLLPPITEIKAITAEAGENAADGFVIGFDTGIKENGGPAIENTLRDEFQRINESVNDFFATSGFKLGEQLFNDVASSISGALNDIADQEKEYADGRVENSERIVNSLEQELIAEQQRSQQGLANRAQAISEELSLAKEAQDRALTLQVEADKKKRRAQAVQRAADLVSGVASTLGSIPFPYSLIAVGALLAAFISSTAKAKQIASQDFGEGGLEIIGGGSHRSGNDTSLGFQTASGKSARGEQGEAHMIIDKQRTRQYKNLLPEIFQGLKNGTFHEQFRNVSNAGMNIPMIATNFNMNTSVMERHLSNIEKQGSKSSYVNGKGQLVTVKGNTKTIYLNR